MDNVSVKLKRRNRREEGLLLTPLIDMIFLVVIFFVLNTSFTRQSALNVKLPQAVTGLEMVSSQTEIRVTITEDRRLYIDKEEVKLEELEAVLSSRMKGQRQILIQGHENTPYKLIIKVMDAARALGLEGVTLVTERIEP